MNRVLSFFVWFIAFCVISTFSFGWISSANTLMNVLGISIWLIFIYISFKTEFFGDFGFMRRFLNKINGNWDNNIDNKF